MRLRRAAALVFVCCTPLPAQNPPPAGPDSRFTYVESMVAMRDGVKLRTVYFVPKDQTGPLPILFVRTPYGVPASNYQLSRAQKELVDEGFIFAYQDIRGRYGSEGTFVMQRPPRPVDAGRQAVDESTDAYDTIDWMLKNVPSNNGRVGMFGVSYPGWTTAMAMLDPHPALKAVSPQASPSDMFIGDDFHHNGAFRLSYGLEYAFRTEASKENGTISLDRYDTYEWYLALGPLSNVQDRYLKDKHLPTWDDFRTHPNYDAFWQRQAMKPYLKRVTVPTLNIAGWWDQEDFYGAVTIYRELEKHDSESQNFLVVGPWNHGGWSAGPGQKLGNIDFGSPTGEYYRTKIQTPFFAHYLKDKGDFQLPEATVFEAGNNVWRSYSAWPPKEAKTRSLYFHADGRLSFSANAAAEGVGYDSYVSDPAHPVPYRNRPIEATYNPTGSQWRTWLMQDQRFVQGRPDVLSYETEPLAEDVVVAGDITAKLFVSMTGQDADFVAKLIDVYPEDYPQDFKLAGYELMVANDVFRGRFRESFEKPKPFVPGEVTPVTIDLHTQSYRFKKGHKIMVQVQSSWFPVIDRNPQSWVPNIFEAKASDYKAETLRVWRTPQNGSRIEISTVAP
jgi:uncharacterized protein